MLDKIYVKKNNGTRQNWSDQKILDAVAKSAVRVNVELTAHQKERILSGVKERVEYYGITEIPVVKLHTYVEEVLEEVSPKVAESYRNYRNFKIQWNDIMKEAADKADVIMYRGDKENANKDSALVSTQQALIRSEFSKLMYKAQFLTNEEKAAIMTGFIYIHDMDARMFTMNCCLFRIARLLKGGFEMGNQWYNEPKSLDVAFDVIGDIVLSSASQQYGGYTIPEVDKILTPYAEKSYNTYYEQEIATTKEALSRRGLELCDEDYAQADRIATEKVTKDYKQGFQGWEYKFNTVGSSRGDYPFITVTTGLDTSKFGDICNRVIFKVHMEGQGKDGFKKPVLFPKYVYLFDENINGEGTPIFEAALECSRKTMYPDWLSLTGDGYVASMYKQYGKVVSPMGCRAFLSPYYEIGKLTEDGSRDHFYPAEDKEDVPVFEGRFNAGAISLNLPLIYLDAKTRGIDFYERLDYFLQMIRSLHLRTKAFLGEKKASINPLGFCEGGFYGGNLQSGQKLKESVKMMEATTYSFGITALNELQMAHNGKSIAEDGQFAVDVMNHINDFANEYKKKDHILYAIYGTPAENLCGLQIKQLRNYTKLHIDELEAAGYEVHKNNKGEFVIDGICNRDYVSNSFHCHVTEEITPFKKQDLEDRFWNLCNGGKIQYVRYPVGYNKDAMKTTVLRAMKLGFYEGVNLALNYCDDCGHEEIDMSDTCPCCGSKNITKIDRMNGYLAFSRVKGDSRLNDAKMAEIADRKSM